jgi:hypothetical protein
MNQILNIKELESRFDNWDEAKKIMAVFAELNLLHCFAASGINAAEMLRNITGEQVDRLISAITGIERHYNTFEALGCFNSFLLFFYSRIGQYLISSAPQTMTTANPSRSSQSNDHQPPGGET